MFLCRANVLVSANCHLTHLESPERRISVEEFPESDCLWGTALLVSAEGFSHCGKHHSLHRWSSAVEEY